ncbi:MAG: phosphatidylglycerol lysyltransferase domain-containing protein, partial [Burkholderiaceae bacterium]
FVLGEIMTEQMMVVHVAKTHPGLPGVQPMMFHHTATAVADRVRWFNFEQDLGFEDFRLDKQAYQPASLLQKYRLRPSDRG